MNKRKMFMNNGASYANNFEKERREQIMKLKSKKIDKYF
jgi:hypothetical protein